MRRRDLFIVLILAQLAAPCAAAITAVSGNIELVSAPASVQLDATQSNDHAIAFDEQQLYHFTTTKWDLNGIPGLYDGLNDLQGGYLFNDVYVQSHFFHADPVSGSLHIQGSITFDHRILAIAMSEVRLEETESAGLSSVLYPKSDSTRVARGLELPAGDFFRIDPNGRTLEIDATTTTGSDGFDQMRILTLASDVTGDYNGDGVVDASDYAVWSRYLPRFPMLSADGNGNGILDAADYTVWRDHLATGGASSSPVPEPGSILLCLLAAILSGQMRRWQKRSCCRLSLSFPAA
jgi:hypothetical protein